EGSGPNPRSHFQNRLASETRNSLLRRAREHLAAIQGQGAFGPRAEFLLSRLAQECSDPATLLAMSAGAAAFRLTRLSVLSRLLSSPESVWTRGLGARALAGISAFAVESPIFALTGKGLRQGAGRAEAWDAPTLGRELTSAYLFMGATRFSGGLAQG